MYRNPYSVEKAISVTEVRIVHLKRCEYVPTSELINAFARYSPNDLCSHDKSNIRINESRARLVAGSQFVNQRKRVYRLPDIVGDLVIRWQPGAMSHQLLDRDSLFTVLGKFGNVQGDWIRK